MLEVSSTWGLALDLLDRNVEYRPALCHREGCGNPLRQTQEIYCSRRCSAICANPEAAWDRDRTCPICGKHFVAERQRNTFCSVTCANKARNQNASRRSAST